MKKKNPTVAIILLIIFIMILGFLSYIFFYNLNNDNTSINAKESNEFSSELQKMGETIYKDYYYEITKVDKTDEQLKSFLSKFETIGLQFNLVELSKYSDENKATIDSFLNNNKKCSRENTMVIIYPKDPYTKIDFTTETKIDCLDKK